MSSLEWVPIPGFGERYEWGPAQQVRVIETGRVLKATLRYDGYYFLSLSWPGGRAVVMLHALVALMHIGPRPPGSYVRHLDGSRSNNDPANLAYGTPQENSDDARLHGVVARGEQNGQSKLTARTVAAVRRLGGLVPHHVLADWLCVTQDVVSKAVRGATWPPTEVEISADEALVAIFNRPSAQFRLRRAA